MALDSQLLTLLTIYESRVTNHGSSCILFRMHDLGYFREHLSEFEQMAVNRGVAIDFDRFRAVRPGAPRTHYRRGAIESPAQQGQRGNPPPQKGRRRRLRIARGNETSIRGNQAGRRAHRRAGRAAFGFHADCAESPAQFGARRTRRLGKRRGAPLGRAAKIRFQAAPALGNRGERRESSIFSAPQKSPARGSPSIEASARAWNAPWLRSSSIRMRQTGTPKFFRLLS